MTDASAGPGISETPDAATWIAAVRSSHDRFAALVAPLDEEAVRGPSYDPDWTIADVASHLGSQAEIFALFLDAGLTGGAGPGGEAFGPIWDRWNAKSPAEQVADSVSANEAFVQRLEGVSEAERASFTIALFGGDTDLAGLVATRLGEHALHTWDVEVALDPSAVVAPDAAHLLIDRLAQIASRVGKPVEEARPVSVRTADPARTFLISTGPDVDLAPCDPAAVADLTLPAEALVRLVYGRLDVEHTPGSVADDESVAMLRQVFPGF
jgi:uncharacterized protein (TIGR03083 family)